MKALGIILIVIGHSAIHTELRTFAYLINIAVFFFVAGYFFKDEYLYHPLLFFKKKIIRYYLPWVMYGLLFVLLHNLFLELQLINYNYQQKTAFEPYTSADLFRKSIEVLTFFKWKEPLLAPLWFLFGMFSGLSVFYSVSWFSKKVGGSRFEFLRGTLIVLLMLFGFLGNAYDLPLAMLYRPLVISGLIYIGKLYHIHATKLTLSPLIALLCLIELLIATKLNYQINIGAMVFGHPLLFLIISCSGTYMLLTIAHYIDRKTIQLSKLLNHIGIYSFSIMVLHYVSFKLVILLQIWIYNYPMAYLSYYPVMPKDTNYWWLVYTLVGVSVPLILGGIATEIQKGIVTKLKAAIL